MASVRYADIASRPTEFLDFTSLTLDEFQLLLPPSLLLGFGVLADQQLNERTQQRFASPSHVVNELEEPEVERKFLL